MLMSQLYPHYKEFQANKWNIIAFSTEPLLYLEELLILNRPCRPGEDIKIRYCPNHIGENGSNGKPPGKKLTIELPMQGSLVCR